VGLAFVLGALVLPAGAAKEGFPRSYNPETASGFTNTYSTNEVLTPACPEGIAATPGSEPASKVLNPALNTGASFEAGGTVHFTYLDNPHTNPGTQNFTIQDCVVTYPAGFFSPSDFDPVTGALINPQYDKSRLVKGGTQIDGAALSGIRSSVGNIYFSWTAPAGIAVDTWVCFFARDIRNNHGGGGNRKVPPTCYRVTPPPNGTTTSSSSTSTSSSTSSSTSTTINEPFVDPTVHLGYADTTHGTTVQFLPDPWLGDPGVTFLGCVAPSLECGQTYDGGAIRVDNPATNPALTLTSAVVAYGSTNGTCTYRTWDGMIADPTVDKTVAPGGTLILTQTGTLGPPQPAPCDGRVGLTDRPFTNFDTSEGPLDTISPPFSNCDPSDSVVNPPVVTLTFSSGLTLTIVDNPDPTVQNDEILTTGGVDRFACIGLDEAAPWTAVPAVNVTVTP
jgi:hypothetical protein